MPVLPVPALRAAVEAELSGVSLRQAAREIGLSPNAVRNFVRGAVPRRTTRLRLERWLSGRPASPGGPSVHRFLRLLGDVTPGLPSSEAASIGREVTRMLLDAYERRRLPSPRWVRELVRHYGPQRP